MENVVSFRRLEGCCFRFVSLINHRLWTLGSTKIALSCSSLTLASFAFQVACSSKRNDDRWYGKKDTGTPAGWLRGSTLSFQVMSPNEHGQHGSKAWFQWNRESHHVPNMLSPRLGYGFACWPGLQAHAVPWQIQGVLVRGDHRSSKIWWIFRIDLFQYIYICSVI